MPKATRPGVLTKTIPLSGGRQDDVGEYVQDTPTLTEATNVRFRKQGEAEKALPMQEVGAYTALTMDPVVMSTVADKIFAVGTEGDVGLFDESDGSWAEQTSAFTPSRNTVASSLDAQVGATNYSFAENDDFRMVAYERGVPGSNTTLLGGSKRKTDVVIEIYSLSSGQLIERHINDLCHSPQVINTNWTLACFYARNPWTVETYTQLYKRSLDWSTSDLLAEVSLGIDADVGYPRDGVDYDDLRIGFCEDGGGTRLARYKVAGDRGPTEQGGLIVWKEYTGSSMQAQKLTTSGGLSGSSTSVTGSGDQMVILDVDVADDACSVMYAWCRDNTPWESDVWINEGTCSGNPSFTGANIIYNGAGTVTNGSVYISGANNYYAFTAVPRDPDANLSNNNNARVTFGWSSGASNVPYDTIYDHRLMSKVVKVAGESAVAAVLEQWNTTEPNTTASGNQYIPNHIKAKTAILTEVYATHTYKLVTAFDVGQCQNIHVSGSEQSQHLNTLTRDTATPYNYKFINRVQLVAEDIGHQATGNDTLNKATMVYHPGEFRATIYEVEAIAATNPLNALPFGNSAILNSAIPTHYDGSALMELSPLDQPEIIDFRLLGAAAGLGTPATHYTYELNESMDADATRTVVAVTGYTDRTGHVHRSAPSFPMFVMGNVDAANDGDDLWRCVRVTRPLSMATASRNDYFIEIYIGQGSNAQQLAGRFPFDTTTATDGAVFAFIDSNKLGSNLDPVRFSPTIYTAGNVLAADPWPNFDDFVMTSNRMFAIGSANKGNIYYSKLFEENIAPEFSASLIIPIGRTRDLTAIGAIDDKVIVFTEDEIFAIYNTGPDNTGANGDFIVDRLQTSFGCSDAESLVEFGDGLAFYSRRTREFHLVTRDLQVVDIGKPVADASDAVATEALSVPPFDAALNVPDQHEIRWHANWTGQAEFGPDPDTGTGIPARPARPRFRNSEPATGAALVYNYHYQKWSIQRPNDTVFSLWTVLDGRPFALSAAGSLRQEQGTDGNWYDAEPMSVTTPWIRVANLQSYGRIDELVILGKYLSSWNADNSGGTYLEAGDVQVELFYDYEEYGVTPDTYRFRANRGDIGTESDDRMQLSVHPGQPKAQAIKVRITEVDTEKVEVSEPGYVPGRGFSLTALDILYSPKAGTGSKNLSQQRSK